MPAVVNIFQHLWAAKISCSAELSMKKVCFITSGPELNSQCATPEGKQLRLICRLVITHAKGPVFACFNRVWTLKIRWTYILSVEIDWHGPFVTYQTELNCTWRGDNSLFVNENIWCDPSLELSQQDRSCEGSQHMFYGGFRKYGKSTQNHFCLIPLRISTDV